MKITFSTQ